MKEFFTKKIFILFICFYQIILTENNYLDKNKSFKPFISVLSEKSIKQFKEGINEEKAKFLENFEDFKDISILEEDEKSAAETKLRQINFSIKCMLVDNFTVYDISQLTQNYLKTNQGGHKQTVNGTEIYYNFCYDLKNIDGCNEDKKQIFAKYKEGNSTKCISLASSINKGNTWSIMQDNSDNKTFLQIELNGDKKHRVLYKLKCNEKENNKFNTTRSYFNKTTENGLETVLFFETKEACPKFDFYVIWTFVNDYFYIFATILIAFGLFNCIFGQKLAQYTSFILTLFGVTVASLFLFQFILPPGCAQWIIWVILSIGIILGCTAGYFVFQNYKNVMSFLVGGLAGFLLGEFLFNLFGNLIKANLTLINILFIVVSIIATVILAFFIREVIIIFATSFIGAYALIRGISLFAGHFPSEFTIIDLKKRGEDDQLKELLTWRVYIYLVFIVITCGLSIFIQIKINHGIQKSKEGECPEDKDENLVNSD